MPSRLREPFGKAGLIVAIVALVASLAGGAIAADLATDSGKRNSKRAKKNKRGKAAGLNAKQKKQVRLISAALIKRSGTAGPAGPQGPAGPAGPAGPKGDKGSSGSDGTDGSNGTDGANGSDGTSAEALAYSGPECDEASGESGLEVKSAASTAYVCNGEPGEEGEPWNVGGVPGGAVLKGTWAFSANTAASEGIHVPVSTTVPLQGVTEVELALQPPGLPIFEIECNGTVADPLPPVKNGAPEPAAMCVYKKSEENLKFTTLNVASGTPSTGGLVLRFQSAAAGPASGFGSWAMYAPEPTP